MILYRQANGQELTALCHLYHIANWWDTHCSEAQIEAIIQNSFCFLTAWEGDTLVGMGRAISDRVSDAYLQDIYVLESHRKQGIASEIVKRLITFCNEREVFWIALISAPGSLGVYKHLGFSQMEGFIPMQLQK